jgi:methyl-accepting chemotaxis protein
VSLKRFDNLKISNKIVVPYLAVGLAAAIVVGLVGLIFCYKISGIAGRIYDENVVPMQQLSKIQEDYADIILQDRNIALNNPSQDTTQTLSEDFSDIDTQIAGYSQNVSSSKIQTDAIKTLKTFMSSLKTSSDQEIKDAQSGKIATAVNDMNQVSSSYSSEISSEIDILYSLNNKNSDALDASNTSSIILATIMIIIFGILAALAAFLIGRRVSLKITKPIEKLVEFSDYVSKGDLSVKIDIDSTDEVGVLAQAFIKVIASFNVLGSDVNMLVNAALNGELHKRADITKHQGDYRKIIDGVNQTIEAIVGPLEVSANYVDRISKGDIPEKITDSYNGDFNVTKNNLNTCIDAVNLLISDTNMLTLSALEGKLSTRADVSKHNGDFRKIVEGVNDTLDAVVDPLQVAANYVDKISKGDIPEKITEEFNGDFNIIKNNLNTCIDAVNLLISDANTLTVAALEGNLSTRADISQHQGDFRKIVEGINDTLDAVVDPLQVAADYVDKISKGNIPEKITENYNGDFNVIKNNINTCINAVNLLISDTNMLTVAALEGRLSTRADAKKHQGDFRKIVDGINKTLNAVVEPIQESASVLDEMSKGNLNVAVRGDYKGDHADIKNSLNKTIKILSEYVNDISSVLSQLASGNFNISITADYVGNFVEIKKSINNIVDSLNDVMAGIETAAEQVSSGSRQVSVASQSLSQGTTEQASAVEQLTSSIAEVASQTKQNAVNAGKANQLSSEAINSVSKGTQTMEDLLSAMSEINESSSKISKIVKVIDDIAFQTNILALNAAVEAARAGQSGKGFAVVAEEVRNLAARSADAAKETTELIQGSIDKVEIGTKLSNETSENLDLISKSIEKAASLVDGIVTSSNEQATAISQIDRGISQVSTVVQTTSATSEETAASSEELSSQADLLLNSVRRFQLKK